MRPASSLLWSALLVFPVFSLGAPGCKGKAPPAPGAVLPDTCSASGTAAVGNIRLQLVGPNGQQKTDTQACRPGVPDLSGQVIKTDVLADKTTPGLVHYTYTFSVNLPPFLPASETQWVVVPPPVVTSDGMVSEYEYDAANQQYDGAVQKDVKGKNVVSVLKLQVDGQADVTAPVMTKLDVGMGLVEQGGTLQVTASFTDDLSGLPMAPQDQQVSPFMPPMPTVAQLSLLYQNVTVPIWTLGLASQTVSGVIPGVLPPGNYPVYAQAADIVGNSARWQLQPGVMLNLNHYQRVPMPQCPQINSQPGPENTALSLQVVIVGSVMTADRQPPQLVSLDAALAGEVPGPGPITVKPCQEMVLQMGLTDDRALPAMQQAMIWVLPLDPKAQACGIMQVPAYTQNNPGVLQANLVLPADAATGTWLFLPAYAVDNANNAIVGTYLPPADGLGMGTISLQNPITGKTQIAPIPPGQFVVSGPSGQNTHDGGAAAQPQQAQLTELKLLSGSGPVTAGGPVQIQASYAVTGNTKLPN